MAMNLSHPDQPFMPSIMDRFRGEGDSGNSIDWSIKQLKKNIREDLEDLLNTRKRPIPIPEKFEILKDSLVNYGIPDPIGYDMSSKERIEMFRDEVETAIKRFEKRLFAVRVTLRDDIEITERIIRFRIEATLRVSPVPERVVFSIDVEPKTKKIDVKSVQ